MVCMSKELRWSHPKQWHYHANEIAVLVRRSMIRDQLELEVLKHCNEYPNFIAVSNGLRCPIRVFTLAIPRTDREKSIFHVLDTLNCPNSVVQTRRKLIQKRFSQLQESALCEHVRPDIPVAITKKSNDNLILTPKKFDDVQISDISCNVCMQYGSPSMGTLAFLYWNAPLECLPQASSNEVLNAHTSIENLRLIRKSDSNQEAHDQSTSPHNSETDSEDQGMNIDPYYGSTTEYSGSRDNSPDLFSYSEEVSESEDIVLAGSPRNKKLHQEFMSSDIHLKNKTSFVNRFWNKTNMKKLYKTNNIIDQENFINKGNENSITVLNKSYYSFNNKWKETKNLRVSKKKNLRYLSKDLLPIFSKLSSNIPRYKINSKTNKKSNRITQKDFSFFISRDSYSKYIEEQPIKHNLNGLKLIELNNTNTKRNIKTKNMVLSLNNPYNDKSKVNISKNTKKTSSFDSSIINCDYLNTKCLSTSIKEPLSIRKLYNLEQNSHLKKCINNSFLFDSTSNQKNRLDLDQLIFRSTKLSLLGYLQDDDMYVQFKVN